MTRRNAVILVGVQLLSILLLTVGFTLIIAAYPFAVTSSLCDRALRRLEQLENRLHGEP